MSISKLMFSFGKAGGVKTNTFAHNECTPTASHKIVLNDSGIVKYDFCGLKGRVVDHTKLDRVEKAKFFEISFNVKLVKTKCDIAHVERLSSEIARGS